MEVAVDELEFGELLSLFKAVQEFIEFLENEDKKEIEKRNK